MRLLHFPLPKGLLVFLWWASLPFGYAQTRTLTLDEAVKLGMEHSRQLKLSSGKVDVARLKIKQYWAAQVPNISLNSTYSHLSDNVTPFSIKVPNGTTLEDRVLNPPILNQFTNRLSVQQVLYSGLRAINFFKSSEILEKAIALDYEKDKIEIRNNIINAVLNLYKLQQTRRALDENLKLLRGRQTDTKNFVNQGTALENDLLKVDLAITQVETIQKELDNGISSAQFTLTLLLGLPENGSNTEGVVLDEKTLFSDHSSLDLDAYLLAAKGGRPDVSAIEQRRLASEKMLEVSKGGYMPIVSAGANLYLNNPNQRVFPQTDAFKGTWDVGLSLSWNISALYTNQFQVQEAQVNLTQIGLQKEQLTEGIKTEVATAYYNYKTGLEKISLSDKAIVQANENHRVTKNRFDAQIATMTELLDADFLLFQSQINNITGKTEAEIAYYKLMKAIGK